MTEKKGSCVEPAKGPILPPDSETDQNRAENEKEVFLMQAKVGKAAPDFEASAYLDGDFKNIKLSDHKGSWVILCFYPADFTFV